MRNINLFCFGFGQVAEGFVKKLIKENYEVNLIATSRFSNKKIPFKKYRILKFTEKKFDQRIKNLLSNVDYLLISIPPKNGTDIVLESFGKILKKKNLSG